MGKKLSELKPSDEVVVKLGARSESQNGKTVEIDPKKEIVVTKAAYDEMAKTVDEDGHSSTLLRTVKLAGTPIYKDEVESLAGSHREIEKTEALTNDTKKAKSTKSDSKTLMPKGDKTGEDEDDLGEENEGENPDAEDDNSGEK